MSLRTPALRFLDRLVIWGRQVEIGSVIAALSREARDHLHVLEARGLQRHGKASLDCRSRCLVGKPHLGRALRLLAQIGDGLGAVGGIELLVGVGERRQDAAFAIFLRRGEIDVRPSYFDLRKLDPKCLVRPVPNEVLAA